MNTAPLSLFPGVTLALLQGRQVPPPAAGPLVELYHCRGGQLRWQAGPSAAGLGPGDYAVRAWAAAETPRSPAPDGGFTGCCVRIRVEPFLSDPPDVLAGLGREVLEAGLPADGVFAVFPGSHATDDLFDGFYDQPEPFARAMARVKALELLLWLLRTPWADQGALTRSQTELVAIARAVHARLTEDFARRYTIEELSRQFAVNPTTLKSAFKAVYGNSLAAHIKEHRMEEAARLLLTTDRSIAQIAQDVGYESQSKFTAAFKSHFQCLPREYRKPREGKGAEIMFGDTGSSPGTSE